MARRIRIRTKLLLYIFVAGFVPLVVATYVALRVVRDRTHENLRAETERSLRVGLNLVLGGVQQVSADIARIGQDDGLRTLLRRHKRRELSDPAELGREMGVVLNRHREQMTSGVLELTDWEDQLLSRQVLDTPDAEVVPVEPGARSQVDRRPDRNRYLQTVDIVEDGEHPAIRASAPVVDEDFEVLGTVAITVPLDHRFAEVLRSTLVAHVGFYLKDRPVASSFRSDRGGPLAGVPLDSAFRRGVVKGHERVTSVTFSGKDFAVGALPLVNSSGQAVGLFYVALDRQQQEAGKWESYRSLLMGGAGVFLMAFIIASLVSRGLARPLTELHARAMAVARGDLGGRTKVAVGGELGELLKAFDDMTEALRENQQRLAARISEIVTLHNIGRAVSSVVGLEEVLRTVVEETRKALAAQITTILLADAEGRLALRAWVGPVKASPEGSEGHEITEEDHAYAALLIGQVAYSDRRTLCIDEVEVHPELGKVALAGGLRGSVMVVPLEHKGRELGVMIINRQPPAEAFGEGELRLLSTFASQASTAIENARLYEEVTLFNERLEQMVEERTAELTCANADLARALEELQEAQDQVIISERLAGLGQLVAGIAHEVNTPAGAIQGAVENLDRCLGRLLEYARQLANLGLSVEKWNLFMDEVMAHATRTELRPSISPLEARQAAKDLAATLDDLGVPDAWRLARRLVDLGAGESAARLLRLTGPEDVQPLLGCLQELVTLRRNALAIGTAIGTVNRIVAALRAYSHLDQTRVDRVNLHDGIETTLIILASRFKHDVTVTRRFGELPPVPVYVDELNQVWTNLLVNAADALEGRGEVVIETEHLGEEVAVRIIDRGKGIPKDVLSRIFKPFFTTKPQGKGTGLGLGICRRIVDKHGGRLEAESEPGRTCFSVILPVDGPPAWRDPEGVPEPGPCGSGPGSGGRAASGSVSRGGTHPGPASEGATSSGSVQAGKEEASGARGIRLQSAQDIRVPSDLSLRDPGGKGDK